MMYHPGDRHRHGKDRDMTPMPTGTKVKVTVKPYGNVTDEWVGQVNFDGGGAVVYVTDRWGYDLRVGRGAVTPVPADTPTTYQASKAAS